MTPCRPAIASSAFAIGHDAARVLSKHYSDSHLDPRPEAACRHGAKTYLLYMTISKLLCSHWTKDVHDQRPGEAYRKCSGYSLTSLQRPRTATSVRLALQPAQRLHLFECSPSELSVHAIAFWE